MAVSMKSQQLLPEKHTETQGMFKLLMHQLPVGPRMDISMRFSSLGDDILHSTCGKMLGLSQTCLSKDGFTIVRDPTAVEDISIYKISPHVECLRLKTPQQQRMFILLKGAQLE